MKNHQNRHTRLNLKKIGIIVGILGVFFTAVYYYLDIIKPNIFPEPSFVVSLDTLEDSLQQGGILQHTVTVKNLNDYDDYTVSLSASSKSGVLPQGIILEFQPPTGGPKPSYTSSLLISVAEDFPIGNYDLVIKGTGSTGYETECLFSLNVVPAAVTTLAEPSAATGAIPVEGGFYPSHWIGDFSDLTFNDACTNDPHSDATCVEINYSARKSQGAGWAGIYWQYPDKNLGDLPGYDWSKKELSKLTFWARGQGVIIAKAGGIKNEGKPYYDSISSPITTGNIVLEEEWTQYTIDLGGADLSCVIGGFCFVVNVKDNPGGSKFYLDDIQFE